MQTKYKQVREVVDYDLQMQDYFEDLEGDEVQSVLLENDNTTAPPLEFGPNAHETYELVGDPRHVVKIWVGGGLDRETYKITAVITTVLGRVEEAEFKVKVKNT